jgi:hypothetical protein
MPLTYNTFVTSLANMIVVSPADAGYIAALPNIIDDAEQRLYRDLDLLSTVVSDSSGALVANNRNFTLPTTTPNGNFVVVEQMNVITPEGVSNPDLGTRNPLLPVSKEYLDAVGGSPSFTGVPTMMAPISQQQWIVGPAWPDAAYSVEVVGTIRPAPLSSGNQTTFLSQYLSDLFLAAALVMSAGYQKNFSSMGDNPKSSVSWESHVQVLLESAKTEELRKKFGSQGWSSKSPDPIATPPRT